MSASRSIAMAALRASTRPTWMPRTMLRASRLANPIQTRAFSELHPTPIFHLTETEQLLQDTVDRFSKEDILPKVRDMDEAEMMDPKVVEGLFENGLMGVEIPEEFGGAGMGFGEAILAVEALAKVDPSVSVMCDVHNTLVNTVFLKYGSKAIKEEFLPRLATKDVGSFCLSEPASGSDAFALQTKAKLSDDGSHYILNGSKSWITNAYEAGVFIVFANVAPEKGYKGITAFIVEKGQEGFKIAKKEKKLGIKASSTCQLTFDDVKVPKDRILGEVGKGYKIAISILNEGRIGIAAQMIGLAQGAFNNAVDYVFNERKQFGQYIGDFQGMQFHVAQARVDIEAARALVWNAVRVKQASDAAIAAGEPTKGFVAEAAMAKLLASQVAQKVSGSAIEWMGGMGFVREGLAEKFWRDSKIGAIYEGTSNIQLQTIAKLLQKEVKR